MLLESSDEEEDEEEESTNVPAVDFAAEAAATAARSVAGTAAKSYGQTLMQKCLEAVEVPAIQEAQAVALEQHAAAHPEMQSKLPPKPATPAPAPQPVVPEPVQQQPEPVQHQPEPAQQPEPVQQPEPAQPQSPQQLEPGSAQSSPVQKQPPVQKKAAVTEAEGKESKGKPRPKAQKPEAPSPQQRPAKVRTLDASREGTVGASSAGNFDSFGVKEDIFLKAFSRHASQPIVAFAEKLPSPMIIKNTNPAPGTYPPLDGARYGKYQVQPTYTFPSGKRFRRDGLPLSEKRPGPGHYPTDKFERFKYVNQTTNSFGSAPRGRANPIRTKGPGPGEYDVRGNPMKDGKSFTMQGKFRKRGVLNYNDPGPGAYDPSTILCDPMMPKTGFGTSLREDYQEKRERDIPGPGAYDILKRNPIGTDSAKFSVTSRRKQHDLSGYLSPGPGMYNHHSTFGYMK
mmetsp:Transcript_1180/g.2391  ORF Transcript_1180/g.2391 Transcript_1180/m.2391 type:complete len:455 (-) Transcript_1180:87-1451(-)|eukprot:CAMPEP_0197649334 /NCGR_PEP_ID=MMETSP1338-20131121/28291_1 /TAXON_ID=43686 ORGANISM="Pelagodinium beii, Strain RCC1491" /NCGR_SAMPLE_ID=MMETSP1338 /ASSEMBLY_ACC=CAM_ASM_000754 /LENGTH=454 /DNA_ID=CAMNT_0043223491 /DNA_START=48 /DNA_END=1412 /DNA_ORIENTATION=+